MSTLVISLRGVLLLKEIIANAVLENPECAEEMSKIFTILEVSPGQVLVHVVQGAFELGRQQGLAEARRNAPAA
jgi:hypothetical protein